jgi:hypothetical protein
VENPFRPSAGATPPEILGRAGVLDEFEYGLRLGSGAPGLLTIFTGARGIGKTVIIGAAHDIARENGWAVISETATAGFMGRIGESMRHLAEELGTGPVNRRITAIAAAGFRITTQLPPERQVAWRTLGEDLLRLLDERGNGLSSSRWTRSMPPTATNWPMAASVQHFIQDRPHRPGLRRATRCRVRPAQRRGGHISPPGRQDRSPAAVREVEESFASTFAEAAFRVSPDLVRHAAEATGGYPFLIQLVGIAHFGEQDGGNSLFDLPDEALSCFVS